MQMYCGQGSTTLQIIDYRHISTGLGQADHCKDVRSTLCGGINRFLLVFRSIYRIHFRKIVVMNVFREIHYIMYMFSYSGLFLRILFHVKL
jgi:hypothetical protein